MTSLSIFLALSVSSSLAIIVATPRQLSSLREAGIVFLTPPRLAIIQAIILSAIAAALGVALRGSTAFSLLNSPGFVIPTLVATIIGLLGHLVLYYLIFRPRIPPQSALLAERIRLAMGLLARLLQGGVTEEVQFRWGLVSVAAAIAFLLFAPNSAFPVPVAIAVAALLFALFHLIGARQIGLAQNPMEIALILVDNTWGGIIFGWLLWQYGLVAAMISHALWHLAWFPIERWFYRRDQTEIADANESSSPPSGTGH
jgi:hypothetical protein